MSGDFGPPADAKLFDLNHGAALSFEELSYRRFLLRIGDEYYAGLARSRGLVPDFQTHRLDPSEASTSRYLPAESDIRSFGNYLWA
jgi:hypothetical protein